MTASVCAECATHSHVRTVMVAAHQHCTCAPLTACILSCMQAPEQPAGYENAWSALDSRNAAPKPSRRTTRNLPQVLTNFTATSTSEGRHLLQFEQNTCLLDSILSYCVLLLARRCRRQHFDCYEAVNKATKVSNSTTVWLQAPEKVLDAPDLTDDYYLNLLDWSSQNVVRSRNPLRCVIAHHTAAHAMCMCVFLISLHRSGLTAYGTLPSALPLHAALQHAKQASGLTCSCPGPTREDVSSLQCRWPWRWARRCTCGRRPAAPSRSSCPPPARTTTSPPSPGRPTASTSPWAPTAPR